jgi:hypothetical protein
MGEEQAIKAMDYLNTFFASVPKPEFIGDITITALSLGGSYQTKMNFIYFDLFICVCSLVVPSRPPNHRQGARDTTDRRSRPACTLLFLTQ